MQVSDSDLEKIWIIQMLVYLLDCSLITFLTAVGFMD